MAITAAMVKELREMTERLRGEDRNRLGKYFGNEREEIERRKQMLETISSAIVWLDDYGFGRRVICGKV